jgi:hypothetical protein
VSSSKGKIVASGVDASGDTQTKFISLLLRIIDADGPERWQEGKEKEA